MTAGDNGALRRDRSPLVGLTRERPDLRLQSQVCHRIDASSRRSAVRVTVYEERTRHAPPFLSAASGTFFSSSSVRTRSHSVSRPGGRTFATGEVSGCPARRPVRTFFAPRPAPVLPRPGRPPSTAPSISSSTSRRVIEAASRLPTFGRTCSAAERSVPCQERIFGFRHRE